VASLGQWRGQPLWGHKLVAISANTLLDIQIVLGIILAFSGLNPPVTHLPFVAAAAILAHYSYSVEKRRGSSFATILASVGAIIPIFVLFI